MKNKKIMYIANYFNGDDDDWFIFVAPEECDRETEFRYAYECESGKPIPDYMTIGEIYDITTAYDYRAKTGGEYKINLIETK